jgi:hypothetical protein
VASAHGRWPEGARLLGWADRTLAAAGTEVWPANRRDRERIVAGVREALGEERWLDELAKGERLTHPEMIEMAGATMEVAARS